MAKYYESQAFEPVVQNLPKMLDFVDARLDEMKLDSKEKIKYRFWLEDMLNAVIQHAEGDIKIRIVRAFRKARISVSCKGSQMDVKEYMSSFFSETLDGPESSFIINSYLKHCEDDLKVSYRYGYNVVSLIVSKKKLNKFVVSLLAMLTGVLAGVIIKLLCSEDVATFMATNVFGLGTSLFLRAIKMIIAFLVFFSIASAISEFKDLKELGKVLGTVLLLFFGTSIISTFVSYGTFSLIPVGDTALQMAADSTMKIDAMKQPSSVGEAILGIIPENYLKAFLDVDMIQLLFIAILTGIVVGRMGRHGAMLSNALSDMDEMFQGIIVLIVKLMPVCIFCSMASMVLKLDFKDILLLAGWMGLVYLCDIIVIVFLLLLVWIGAKRSPISYIKEVGPLMMSSFVMASSNAVMPLTIETCRDKLKISPKLYSFSIPLGIVANKDGSCVTLMISTLFLANVFDVPIDGGLLVTLFFLVFMLSIAAPAVSGGLLLVLAVILPSMGIPVVGVSILIGLYFLVAMVDTMTNVFSTVSLTYVVDKIMKKKPEAGARLESK